MADVHSTPSRKALEPAGQMTRVMRAVAQSGPKRLRVGLLREARLIEERLIARGAAVTIGTSEKCTFSISGSGLPATFRLIEPHAKRPGVFRLRFSDAMTGRVALRSGISELAALRSTAKRTAAGLYEVELDSEARGKIVLGDTAVLFQLVVAPPAAARPQLPLSLRQNGFDLDRRTTFIAAFSFLVHFAAVGTLYSDFADPLIDDALVIGALVDALPPIPPPVVEDSEPVAATTADPVATAKPESTATQRGDRGAPSGPRAHDPSATLGRELEQLELLTVGALSSERSATNDVLGRGEVPTQALDAAARSDRGVSGLAPLGFGRNGGPLRPGEARNDLTSLADGRRGAPTHTGTIDRPRGPTAISDVSPPTTTGESVDAERVVAGLRGPFRQCYQKGLDQFPDAEGGIRLTITVGPNGEPQSVGASPSGNLPPMVVSCVSGRARGAQFAAPTGGRAVVVVPVVFRKGR
jgi:hypothetical protein